MAVEGVFLSLMSSAIRGPTEAAASIHRGLTQVVGGALRPETLGTQNLLALWRLLNSSDFTHCAGVLAAKFAAINLLPIPPLNGGRILQFLFLGNATPSWLGSLITAGCFAVLAMYASYLYSLGILMGYF